MAKTQKTQTAGTLERLGTSVFGLRKWFVKSWGMGVLLAKGSYRLGERRRLFMKLGEEVYGRIHKGELTCEELTPLVLQLDRMTKKVKIEELLIQKLRFGSAASRRSRKRPSKKKSNKRSETSIAVSEG